MIWRRLKKSTPGKEARFAEQMEEAKPTAKDKFAMLITAMLVIFVPCALLLIGLALLVLWIFGGI